MLHPVVIGLSAALAPVRWRLPQLLTAPHVDNLKRRKPFVLVERFPYLLMGGVLVVFAGYRWTFALSLLVTAAGALCLSAAVKEPRRYRTDPGHEVC